LRATCLRLEQGSFVDISGLKPSPQDILIHRYVLKKPGVTEVVETSPDVTFQNPLWRSPLRQNVKALFDSIGGRAFGPESIGIRV
jgi:hypothetical protein